MYMLGLAARSSVRPPCRRPRRLSVLEISHLSISLSIHIYIYINLSLSISLSLSLYIYIYNTCVRRSMVRSHSLSPHNFKLRVPNPRTVAYAHSEMPFGGSNLAGTGPILPDWTSENRPKTFQILTFESTQIVLKSESWNYHVMRLLSNIILVRRLHLNERV